ncbi:MAG TPA: hypothetical protein VII54_02135 [Gaiellaceae bacterium]|jgi:hypothetical protein
MRKILVLTTLVAAVVAAVGATGAAAGGPCGVALSETFDHSAISTGTPFSTGTVTVVGVTSTSSVAATVTLDDGSGDTLTIDLTGTTTGSTHLVFTSSSGTITGGTGSCAGASGSVTAGVLKGENTNTQWESTTPIAGGAISIGGGGAGAGAGAPPPPPPDNAFLCYSAFQDNPGVWVMPVATQLLQQGYWSPYAVPGNVAGGTNIGGYHLTCNLASGQSASDSTLGGAGETYGASDKSVVSDVPGHYAIVGS